jgi:uncharacterized membrane protein
MSAKPEVMTQEEVSSSYGLVAIIDEACNIVSYFLKERIVKPEDNSGNRTVTTRDPLFSMRPSQHSHSKR